MAVRIVIEPWPGVRLTSATEADIGENGLDGGHIILWYQRRPWRPYRSALPYRRSKRPHRWTCHSKSAAILLGSAEQTRRFREKWTNSPNAEAMGWHCLSDLYTVHT